METSLEGRANLLEMKRAKASKTRENRGRNQIRNSM